MGPRGIEPRNTRCNKELLLSNLNSQSKTIKNPAYFHIKSKKP